MVRSSAILILASTLSVGPVASSASESYFVSCESALSSAPFRRLKEFYTLNPDEPPPDECFRLNDREFLLTVTRTGRQGQGLFYYDSRTDSYGPALGGWAEPNIQVATEFLGSRGKRYVLLVSANQTMHYTGTTYYLLFLTPRSTGRTFVFKPVVNAAAYWSDNGDACESKAGALATDIEGYKVVNPGTPDVRLVFSVRRWSCATGNKNMLQRSFSIDDQGTIEIEETPNESLQLIAPKDGAPVER
jgi:hypothetical protein